MYIKIDLLHIKVGSRINYAFYVRCCFSRIAEISRIGVICKKEKFHFSFYVNRLSYEKWYFLVGMVIILYKNY